MLLPFARTDDRYRPSGQAADTKCGIKIASADLRSQTHAALPRPFLGVGGVDIQITLGDRLAAS